jgi:hypothetical protein
MCAGNPGVVGAAAYLDVSSPMCGGQACLVNHFQGRVSCPFGNVEGGSAVVGAKCTIPGSDTAVTQGVQPQCASRLDAVHCSCKCGGEDTAAAYCTCPNGFVCAEITRYLDSPNLAPGDKYCARAGQDYQLDSVMCCTSSDPNCSCDRGDHCGFKVNQAPFAADTSGLTCSSP